MLPPAGQVFLQEPPAIVTEDPALHRRDQVDGATFEWFVCSSRVAHQTFKVTLCDIMMLRQLQQQVLRGDSQYSVLD
jgi:hypothetical protein